MNINKIDFERAMAYLERRDMFLTADACRDRDEALVSALNEAVSLLLNASDPLGPNIRYAAIKDFFLRYAQAQ